MDSEEYNVLLKEYQTKVEATKNQNHSDFEKQLIYISSGALGLSMFFIEKVVKDLNNSKCKWVLIASWICLGLTLVINLISHYCSIKFNEETLKEINDKKTDNKKIENRNRILNVFNLITLIFLIFGIVFLIAYLTVNIMPNNDNNNQPNQANQTNLPSRGSEEALSFIPPPPPPQPQPSTQPLPPPPNKD